MPFDENEPVFKRSKWGTNRYEYNPQNPLGLALIVLSVAFAVVMLLLMQHHAGPFARPSDPTPTQWSPPPDMSRWAPPPDVPSAGPTSDPASGPPELP
ncbi:hypothetical protein [Streptomyces sp. NPDC001410]|uniref:hypothetical protein n=1 Tax=Streptomyces sp. NPDC001410 TaxID=3364574 RepID=UPI00369B11E2